MPWGIDFGPGSSFFGSILRSIFGAVQALLTFLWNTLVAVTHFLLSGLIAVANFLLTMLRHIGRFFRNVWENWIKKGVLKLLDLYAKLMEKVRAFLEPILKWIRKIRDLIDYWYNKIFGPILDLIHKVRGVLQVFRVFNLKFARKLDERLARLERKIVEPYLLIRDKLNEIITWAAIITDASNLIRRFPLLQSLGRIFGLLASLTHGRFSRDLTIAEEESQKRDRERYTKKRIEQHRAEILASGPTQDDKEIQAATRKALMEISGLEASEFPPGP